MDNYENHGSFNRHLSLDGFKVNTSGIKPSVYITEVKMRRAIRELSDFDIENIFEDEMIEPTIKKFRAKLVTKIDWLLNWQLMAALNILLRDGNYEAVKYINKCKRSDKEFN